VAREVAVVTKFPLEKLRVERRGKKEDDGVVWFSVEGEEGSWTACRDLASVKRLVMDDIVFNLIGGWDGLLEVERFTWEDVYRALSAVVDWEELRPWVVARAREKRLDENELLADVPKAVIELCCDGRTVDYEEASLALHQQGRVSKKRFASALIDVCGGLGGFAKLVDDHVLVRTPGGLIVEIDESHVLDDAPRIGRVGRKKNR
jgi:hypothetical protein